MESSVIQRLANPANLIAFCFQLDCCVGCRNVYINAAAMCVALWKRSLFEFFLCLIFDTVVVEDVTQRFLKLFLAHFTHPTPFSYWHVYSKAGRITFRHQAPLAPMSS